MVDCAKCIHLNVMCDPVVEDYHQPCDEYLEIESDEVKTDTEEEVVSS